MKRSGPATAVIAGSALGALGACAMVDVPVPAPPVSLINAGGEVAGTVSPAQTSGGITLAIRASGLPHGLHGVHVHGVGRCDPPGFASAGSHWNPSGREHGFNNPEGAHAGDLTNVTVASTGVLSETVVIAGTSLAALADSDGSALILHAAADDYLTDPSGNSGDRIACAVLSSPR